MREQVASDKEKLQLILHKVAYGCTCCLHHFQKEQLFDQERQHYKERIEQLERRIVADADDSKHFVEHNDVLKDRLEYNLKEAHGSYISNFGSDFIGELEKLWNENHKLSTELTKSQELLEVQVNVSIV